ncbi:MAG TPA: plasmid pRiA4b ORF-3 family protein, partial [Agriterribacter sp.]|nr:plasmid pRiA4b ORF-3 family protein [Agriterribacter sp.]
MPDYPPPFKLKVELVGFPFKIVRKVLVPREVLMFDLHMIIQGAMGWTNTHLYEFLDQQPKGKIRVGVPSDYDLEYEEMGFPALRDAQKVHFKDVFYKENKGKSFWYNYDVGDDWQHRLTFQKVTDKENQNYFG